MIHKVEQLPSVALSFGSVKGTTAKNAAQFAASGRYIAYVAGSGVIVAIISSNGALEKQRLFVANSTNDFKSQKPSEISICEDELKKDMYGFPTNYTHYFRGTHADYEKLSTSQFEGKDAVANSGPFSKLKDKVRAPTCVALSPNGKVLAVGESGYQPRVLLFSLAPDSSFRPFAAIYEHSFGICQLAFSPNSKYLCSLGTMSDGFLYIWRYSAISISRKAVNKCTIPVNDLIWHDTGSEFGEIITAGIRSLKIWVLDLNHSFSTSKSVVLKGRNIVLGVYLDSNFHSVVPLGTSEILILEQNGLFLLSLRNDALLRKIAFDVTNVTGIVVDDTGAIWIFDRQYQLRAFPLSELNFLSESMPPSVSTSKSIQGIQNMSINSRFSASRAQCFGKNHVIVLTNNGEIKLVEKTSGKSHQLVYTPMPLVAGGKRVKSGEILLYSKDGKVASFTNSSFSTNLATHVLPQAESLSNELTAIEKHASTIFLGDKYGFLTILDVSGAESKTEYSIKAHGSTINDIIYFEISETPLLCSISRDRMIQVYHKSSLVWDVLGTFSTHTANLLSVSYSKPYLFVCSADRSISVHEFVKADTRIEILHKKTISLKNTPLSMGVSESDLIISSNDRSLLFHDRRTLDFKKSMKLYCEKATEALCVEHFLILNDDQIAVACSDRSLRIFDLVTTKQISSAWGHLESVLGLFEGEEILLSLGSDGVFYEWCVSGDKQQEAKLSQRANDSKMFTSDSEVSPLDAKVMRKFLPTPQAPKSSVSRSRVSSFSSEDTVTEPESPTPRLTKATLKRIEARRKGQSISTPPQDLQATHIISSQKSPFRSKSVSPPKLSLRDSQTSICRSPYQSRQSSVSRSLQYAAKTQSFSSPHKGAAPSLPPPIHITNDINERCTGYLAMIKSFIKKDLLDEESKKALRNDLEETLIILGDLSAYNSLLERYSDELVTLVRGKLENTIDHAHDVSLRDSDPHGVDSHDVGRQGVVGLDGINSHDVDK